MVKREEPGSGLRAGFVRGDGLMQHPRKNEAPRKKEEEPEVKPQPPIPEPVHEPEESTGPTLTMQGVSGKKITGVVKVVKKVVRPPQPVTESETDQPAVSETAAKPVSPAATSQPEPVTPVPSVDAAAAPA
ncbi:MAG: hypothetical protein SCM11_10210, partial [Bacillota bacterium]|nr:hypothetical protein [Bacillota bacterium]